MSIQFLLLMGTILDEESADSLFFVVLLLPSSCMQNLLHSFYRIFFELMLCKFITNLFDPWEILTQLLIRSQFWCSFGSLHEIVRDLQCLSSWNIVQLRNPAPIQNLLNYLVVTAFQFVIHIVAIENLFCWVTTIWRNVYFDNTEHEWGTWLSHHNGSLVKGFILFTYLCDCSVKTELVCRHTYAKNSLNRFHIGCAENWTSTFSKFLSAILSQIPCGLSSLIKYHSEPGPINDHFLFQHRDTILAFARDSVALSLVPQEMSLNIDINRILPLKFSGLSPE